MRSRVCGITAFESFLQTAGVQLRLVGIFLMSVVSVETFGPVADLENPKQRRTPK